MAGEKTLCIPGWATDWRIFCDSADMARQGWDSTLRLGSGTVSPLFIPKHPRLEGEDVFYLNHADPNDMPTLIALLAESPVKWHLVGFSLGGFMAHDLARQVPHKVASLTLIGIREQYPPALCRAMQRQLRQNKTQLLQDFWQTAFGDSGDRCAEAYEADVLSRGLDYLAGYVWEPGAFVFPVTCVHGDADAIAPLSEARCLAEKHNWEWRVVVGGHGILKG